MRLRWALFLTGGVTASALRARTVESHIAQVDIDLDLPPRERWKHVARTRKEAVRTKIDEIVSEWKHHDPAQLDELERSVNVPDEYREEMEGIVEELDHPRLKYRDILFRQMRQELGFTHFDECSGVLVALPNGTMLHGRNLDLPAKNATHMRSMRQELLDVTFLQGGRPLFRSIGFMGLIGIHNGYRRGGWSIEQNTRDTGAIKTERGWLDRSIAEARRGAMPSNLAMRQALQYEATYAGGLARMRSALYMIDHYLILSGAGPYEAAVITVDKRTEASPPWAPVRTMDEGDWFLVQSNDDGGKLTKDARPAIAMFWLEKAGQDDAAGPHAKGTTAFERVLRAHPMCNSGTVFTWYMSTVADVDYAIAEDCQLPRPAAEI